MISERRPGTSSKHLLLLPAGRRRLTEAVHDYYLSANSPTLDRITKAASTIGDKNSREGITSLGRSRIHEILKGTGKLPSWGQLWLVLDALADSSGGSPLQPDELDRFSGLLRDAAAPARQPRTGLFALHFAQIAFAWGEDASRRYKGNGVVVTLIPDSPETLAFEVFDSALQEHVADLQEQKIIRRDGHSFSPMQHHLPTVWRISGPITGHRGKVFVGVELSVFGAVSVYVKGQRSTTPDDHLAYGVLGAWRMALLVHQALGTEGQASAATILSPDALTQRNGPHDQPWLGRWWHRLRARRDDPEPSVYLEAANAGSFLGSTAELYRDSWSSAVPQVEAVRKNLELDPWNFTEAYKRML